MSTLLAGVLVAIQVYACMGSWVQLGNIPGEHLATSTLMMAPFETLVRSTIYFQPILKLDQILSETIRSTTEVV